MGMNSFDFSGSMGPTDWTGINLCHTGTGGGWCVCVYVRTGISYMLRHLILNPTSGEHFVFSQCCCLSVRVRDFAGS